jgi:hypothetical protein
MSMTENYDKKRIDEYNYIELKLGNKRLVCLAMLEEDILRRIEAI